MEMEICGGSKKNYQEKKTITKKRGGMLRGFVPNRFRETLGYETNAQRAKREEEERKEDKKRTKIEEEENWL